MIIAVSTRILYVFWNSSAAFNSPIFILFHSESSPPGLAVSAVPTTAFGAVADTAANANAKPSPPEDDDSGAPPEDDDSGAPPEDDNNGAPPDNDDAALDNDEDTALDDDEDTALDDDEDTALDDDEDILDDEYSSCCSSLHTRSNSPSRDFPFPINPKPQRRTLCPNLT